LISPAIAGNLCSQAQAWTPLLGSRLRYHPQGVPDKGTPFL
jgi:hypothetical protein